MVKKGRMVQFAVCFIVVMATLAALTEARKISYWQTFVGMKSRKINEASRHICFPIWNTRENLGNIVSRNGTTVCIDNKVVVKKFDNVFGWNVDLKAERALISVSISSNRSPLQANKLSNLVMFVSKTSLHHTADYNEFKDQVEECSRYTGRGFIRNSKKIFKCEKIVHGRYFYIWGLGNKRIPNAYIKKVDLEFAI